MDRFQGKVSVFYNPVVAVLGRTRPQASSLSPLRTEGPLIGFFVPSDMRDAGPKAERK